MKISDLKDTFNIKSEDEIIEWFNEICLFKLTIYKTPDAESDENFNIGKAFFKKASEQPVIFVKLC